MPFFHALSVPLLFPFNHPLSVGRVLVLNKCGGFAAADKHTPPQSINREKYENRGADGRGFAANPLAKRPRIPSRIFPISTRIYPVILSVEYARCLSFVSPHQILDSLRPKCLYNNFNYFSATYQ